MNTFFKTLSTVFLLFIGVACERAVDLMTTEEVNTDTVSVNYRSSNPYNLNVVYFVANDRHENPDYHERLSGVMLHAQDFLATWMSYWGYSNTRLGLLADEDARLVKIHVIHGNGPSSNYSYDSGSGNIKAEVDTYFTENPSEKTSDHYLIICAINEDIVNGEEMQVGPPFYGIGRYCYALDYPGMSVDAFGASGNRGWLATVWIGGLVHELGHGINMPHTGEASSQAGNPNFGTSLMGNGNSSYGRSPTFLTHFNAATLHTSQVFATGQQPFYGNVASSISSLEAQVVNNEITLSGTFSSSVPVAEVGFYNQPSTDPGGYRAVTWIATPINNTFHISMPISEFREKENTEYQLSIVLLHTNGASSWHRYGYSFQNGVPIVDFGDKNDYDRSDWQIIDFSSNEVTSSYPGHAWRLIDGDPTTYWHSMWSQFITQHPHYFTIDMQQSLTFGGIFFQQRASGSNGRSRHVRVELSQDHLSWAVSGNYTLGDHGGRQNFALPSPLQARYIKVTVLTSYNESEINASLAEFGVYQ